MCNWQLSPCHVCDLDCEFKIVLTFFCSSCLFAPTSLSICCPFLRKKKVGVALISHNVLNSCIGVSLQFQPFKIAPMNIDVPKQTWKRSSCFDCQNKKDLQFPLSPSWDGVEKARENALILNFISLIVPSLLSFSRQHYPDPKTYNWVDLDSLLENLKLEEDGKSLQENMDWSLQVTALLLTVSWSTSTNRNIREGCFSANSA